MKKVLLVVLDGFGYRKKRSCNAVAQAEMPFYKSLTKKYPVTFLHASSEHVGLPARTMGNSEVGHLTLGAGRVINQYCLRINQSIENESFFRNKTLLALFKKAKEKKKAVHVVGLLSDAGVHAHLSHLLALLKMLKRAKVRAYLHLFTDGRDMDPHSAVGLLKKVVAVIKNSSILIATISGRYYGMDRDKRWKRTKKAYDAITFANGLNSPSAIQAVENAYKRGESDEFINPTVISGYLGINNGDCVFSFNFREDRSRQICWAFNKKGFSKFKCSSQDILLATMTLYDSKKLVCPSAFPLMKVKNSLAEVLSRKGVAQMHVAETEKYAHVTYFFNGEIENPFPGEKRILIQSKKVATYDKTPEMRAREITKSTIKAIEKGNFEFILVNYANADMVGHTGNFNATKKALKVIDNCLAKLVPFAFSNNYAVAITADHGNCEDMTANFSTSHTLNKVPFILISEKKLKLKRGKLSDVAPTLLNVMGIKIPREMTGRVLFK